jgi:hypothetical protein
MLYVTLHSSCYVMCDCTFLTLYYMWLCIPHAMLCVTVHSSPVICSCTFLTLCYMWLCIPHAALCVALHSSRYVTCGCTFLTLYCVWLSIPHARIQREWEFKEVSDPSKIRLRFLVGKVALGQVVSVHLGVLVSMSVHQYSILIHLNWQPVPVTARSKT